jgi:hypothetical protein
VSSGQNPTACGWIRWRTISFGGGSCVAMAGGVSCVARCRILRFTTKSSAATPARTPKKT